MDVGGIIRKDAWTSLRIKGVGEGCLKIWELLASNGSSWGGNWKEDMGDKQMSIKE